MDLEEFKGKFIGPDKIVDIFVIADKTYLGKERVEITYDSEKTARFPRAILEDIATSNKSDLSELREKRVQKPIEQVIQLLVESELTLEDIEYSMGPKLKASLDDALDKANTIAYGKPKYEVTLLDIEHMLKRGIKKEKPKETKKEDKQSEQKPKT